jgi:hypothetical protein
MSYILTALSMLSSRAAPERNSVQRLIVIVIITKTVGLAICRTSDFEKSPYLPELNVQVLDLHFTVNAHIVAKNHQNIDRLISKYYAKAA